MSEQVVQEPVDRVPATLRVRIGAEASDQGWTFVITCARAPEFRLERPVPVLRDSDGLPMATPESDPGCAMESGCLRADPEAFPKALFELRRRQGDGGVTVGHYLFTVLLGSDWPKVLELAREQQATTIELALSWPADPKWSTLIRLPWELMHDGTHYLATSGDGVSVAVTRVVADAGAQMAALSFPAKVLFVVGASLTDATIRPGAEMLALIREVRSQGLRAQHRVLHNATPDRLGHAVNTFRPDVVHFIGHGGETEADQRGYLSLESDERGGDPERLQAAQLVVKLRDEEGRLPPIVVLSACAGAGGDAAGSRLQPLGGPELAAPLAVDLVREGVPVVVAMAGSVTDRACRIFNRAFAGALAAGESLVVATAEARKQAFAQVPAGRAHDWAMPAVFFAAGVDPDAVTYTRDRRRERIDSWAGLLLPDRSPVFCAREEFFDVFWAMEAGGSPQPSGWERRDAAKSPSVLAVCVDHQATGVGKTRLLQELARSALEDGHIPLLLGTNKKDGVPSDLDQLIRHLGAAISSVGFRVLGIGGDHGHQLKMLGARDPVSLELPQQHAIEVREAFTGVGLQEAFLAALRMDAETLLAAAREHYPDVFGANARVIVLIDDLGRESVPVIESLIDSNLTNWHGLGSQDQPMPVVMTVRFEPEDDLRRALSEQRFDMNWVQSLNLRPFDQGSGEDLLAYERVLLHPFRRDGSPGHAQKEWVFNRGLDEEKWKEGTDILREYLQGTPVRFHETWFLWALSVLKLGDVVLPATDDDLVNVQAAEVEPG